MRLEIETSDDVKLFSSRKTSKIFDQFSQRKMEQCQSTSLLFYREISQIESSSSEIPTDTTSWSSQSLFKTKSECGRHPVVGGLSVDCCQLWFGMIDTRGWSLIQINT